MNQDVVKRIVNLEQKMNERFRTPVVIITPTNSGEYEYKGKTYSKERFEAFMEKARPNTIILNDIPREE